jgi:hypothetical protein
MLAFETIAKALGLLYASFSKFAISLALKHVLDIPYCEATE